MSKAWLLGFVLLTSGCGGSDDIVGPETTSRSDAGGKQDPPTTTPAPTTPPAATAPPPTAPSPPPQSAGPDLCVPNAECNGVNECVDYCYGERCCYVRCECARATGRLECILVCQ